MARGHICMSAKSYIDYKFCGIRSFIASLDETRTEYRLFDDDLSSLYEKHSELIHLGEDTVVPGIITREDQAAYFTEFGVKITKSYSAYIVFIFDHHPRIQELEEIIVDLESIIQSNIDKVDLAEIADSLSSRGKTTM